MLYANVVLTLTIMILFHRETKADAAAKKAAKQPPTTSTLLLVSVPLTDNLPPTADLQELKSRATPKKRSLKDFTSICQKKELVWIK